MLPTTQIFKYTNQLHSAMSEVKITYETVFDLLRREKSREDLQQFSSTFLADVVDYLNEKEKLLKNKDTDIFSSTERKKTEKQLENVKRILIELYGRREKKILNLAVEKSITNSGLIDTTNLLNGENELFNDLVAVVSKHRKDILYKILEGEVPANAEKQETTVEEKSAQEESEEQSENPVQNPVVENPVTEEKPLDEPTTNTDGQASNRVKVKFLEPVPKFLGQELEEYGPFNQEDEAEVPEELAKVLVHNKQANIV